MSVKVKTSNIRNFVVIDENTYKALELMGVKVDTIGFKILNDGEEFNAMDYKIVKREEK
jgi:hypothetical protein